MPEEVTIPISLDLTDIKMKEDLFDKNKDIQKALRGLAKEMRMTFDDVDASKATKSLLTAMTGVSTSIQKARTESTKLSKAIYDSVSGTERFQQLQAELGRAMESAAYYRDELVNKSGGKKAPETFANMRKQLANAEADARRVKAEMQQMLAEFSKHVSVEDYNKIAESFDRVTFATREVTNAQIKLNKTAQTDAVTQEYKDLQKEAEKYKAKLIALNEKSKKMAALGATDKQWQTVQYDVHAVSSELNGVLSKMRKLVKSEDAGIFYEDLEQVKKLEAQIKSINATRINIAGAGKRQGTVDKRAEEAQAPTTAWGKASKAVTDFKNKVVASHPAVGKLITACGKIGSAMGKAGAATATVTKKMASGFKSVVSGIGKAISWVKNLGKGSSKTSNDMQKHFKKLTKNIMLFGLGFRSAYYLVKRLRTVFTQGFKAMAASSSEINDQLSSVTMAFNRLKGSLATAFQPLVSVAIPIVRTLMNYLTSLLEMIGKFNATLTGQGYILKASADNVNIAADSATGASKELDKKLGQYDKLEVIHSESDSGSGGGTSKDLGVTYNKASVEGAASDFAKLVKEAWAKSDFTEVGKVVSDKIISTLDSVRTTVLPKVTDFINKILVSAKTFLAGFNFSDIGTSIGKLISDLIANLDFSSLGEAYGRLHAGLWSMIINAVMAIDWMAVWGQFKAGITGVLQGMADTFQSSDNPLLQSAGTVVQSIITALDGIWPVLDQIFISVGELINAIIPFLAQLLPPIIEVVGVIMQLAFSLIPPILDVVKQLLPIVSELVLAVLPVLQEIFEVLTPILKQVFDSVMPLAIKLIKTVIPLVKSVLNLVKSLLAPIGAIISVIIEVIVACIEPIIELLDPVIDLIVMVIDSVTAVLVPILNLIQPILKLISSCIKPIMSIISLLISTIIKPLIDVLNFVISIINAIISLVVKIVTPVIEGVANTVKFVTDNVNEAIKKLKDGFDKFWGGVKEVLNSALGGFEALVNGVIGGVNLMIRALNKLSFDVPDWVPIIGGKKFGFNISEISEVHIPRLAQGAVIPPNREFMATLGDQRHGTNIEAPLDTIKQALAEVFSEFGGQGPIILQLDGKTVAEVVWSQESKRYKQTGKTYAY